MKKKLIATALLSAVSGAVLLSNQTVAAEKKLECIRRFPFDVFQQYPLKFQKDCEPPLSMPLGAVESVNPEPPGSYTS